ncbi:HAMP domain-containing protein [Caloranaerobacter azorensis DSM 13643]|uniref:histidine kinase n=1 Tax=Caloranaerobacter azorensis DSM 13643 TaxID=1121264 RepID=A0A1M5VBY4_9FIRM|nr:ATP-binding protein [Caloranaerobacter azorensis]SHH72782.1 HAMP domain-containing protein [Caloranaerobacter azorensis DSM 13643]
MLQYMESDINFWRIKDVSKDKNKININYFRSNFFSILVVSIVTNITLFKKFDVYMKDELTNRVNEIIKLIEYTYSIDNAWTEKNLNNISKSPLINDFDIVIKDLDGSIIFAHYMESDILKIHNEMMRQMGYHMMHKIDKSMMWGSIKRKNYVTKSFIIEVNGRDVGIVELGYYGPFLVSERELEFARGINNSIIYAAIISLFIAFILGIYSSKIISKPILKITRVANEIRRGNLDTKVLISNNITELKELSKSINHLAESLKEQQELRKRLTADISHELRTPLTILQSHIEAISDGIWEPTQERLDICKNEVIRLIKLVEQLKYLTDIEKHRITLEVKKINLSKLLNEIIDSLEYQFQNKNIKLKRFLKENVFINADKDKVSQIIINILSNALKFTNPGGQVDVALEENEEKVNIIIKDTGIGIPKKDIPYIFERFYRSDKSRSRKTGGAGIGLTIAKMLVEAHNGKIEVESELGKGSKFTVILNKDFR